MTMQITNDREKRREQREILAQEFDDYDPRRHDAFVIWHNKEFEAKATERYMKARGLWK